MVHIFQPAMFDDTGGYLKFGPELGTGWSSGKGDIDVSDCTGIPDRAAMHSMACMAFGAAQMVMARSKCKRWPKLWNQMQGALCQLIVKKLINWSLSCDWIKNLPTNLQIVADLTEFLSEILSSCCHLITLSQDPYTGSSTYGTCPEGNINTSEVLCPRPVWSLDMFGCFSCCFLELSMFGALNMLKSKHT